MGRIFLYKRLKKIFKIMIGLLFAAVPVSSLPGGMAQEHKPLQYEVSVKALQVPFVAADSRGNPVYGLKQEELELYVNGKPARIIYLYRIAFGDADAGTTGEEGEKEGTPAVAAGTKSITKKKVTRLKFLIVDALFNSPQGLKRAKGIARELIGKCAPEDRFVLLEIGLGGLKYIAGPEPGGGTFLKHLGKLRKNPQKLVWWSRPEHPVRDGASVERYLMEDGMRNARRDTVKMYMDAFEQFKNALKTIDNPKVTFLLSEGFSGHIADGLVHDPAQEALLSYRGFEKYLVREVHDGGSVLQKVHVSGFRSRETAPLAEWLNRSTSAYYELFFNPGPKTGEKMNITIKCKRKDVDINAVAHKEKEKPYQKMNRVQKKLFAISVATGRSYSRMLGRVIRTPFKKSDVRKIKNETQLVVQVPIPGEMKDRDVDVFALRFDEKYQDVDVAWETRTAKEWETVTIPTRKNKTHLYFVIVEPASAFCVYGRVR